MTFRAMDPSHIALIDIFWSASDFSKFDCQKADSFNVRVEDFVKILRRANDKDSLTISRKNSDSLSIVIGAGADVRRTFEFHLVDPKDSSFPLPSIKYRSTFTIAKESFDKHLLDVTIFGNHLSITSSPKGVTFDGKGDAGKSNTQIMFEKGSAISSLVCDEEEVKSTYSVEYLSSITKALGDVKNLKLEYSSKMPLRLTAPLGERGTIQFYLAPRVVE
ncbi:MAG: proliferating cell nuclear antigen (pcna) [Nitrosotalea sp.]